MSCAAEWEQAQTNATADEYMCAYARDLQPTAEADHANTSSTSEEPKHCRTYEALTPPSWCPRGHPSRRG
eukprot:12805517-Alexandrium_andersonii.AAC.1